MIKNIIIVNKRQYGYWTDYYYFSKYLSKYFCVHHICYDDNIERFQPDGIKVKYINKRFKNNYLELFHFIYSVFTYSIIVKNKVLFINYFSFVYLFRFLMPFTKLIMDIRTTSITKNEKKRKSDHSRIRFSCKFFNHITILSNLLLNELKLNKKKTTVIPLGADEKVIKMKSFDEIKLLYVGIFNQRNIHETIEGLYHFLERNKEFKSLITYDIIGFGFDYYENLINETICKFKLNNIVQLHGRKKIEETLPYWDNANVGVVYIPKIPAYENQPPTKLFEAFFSGMPVIATKTNENALYVNESNGVLIDDNPLSFSKGLEKLINNKNRYNSFKIKKQIENYSWEKITDKLANVIKNKL